MLNTLKRLSALALCSFGMLSAITPEQQAVFDALYGEHSGGGFVGGDEEARQVRDCFGKFVTGDIRDLLDLLMSPEGAVTPLAASCRLSPVDVLMIVRYMIDLAHRLTGAERADFLAGVTTYGGQVYRVPWDCAHPDSFPRKLGIEVLDAKGVAIAGASGLLARARAARTWGVNDGWDDRDFDLADTALDSAAFGGQVAMCTELRTRLALAGEACALREVVRAAWPDGAARCGDVVACVLEPGSLSARGLSVDTVSANLQPVRGFAPAPAPAPTPPRAAPAAPSPAGFGGGATPTFGPGGALLPARATLAAAAPALAPPEACAASHGELSMLPPGVGLSHLSCCADVWWVSFNNGFGSIELDCNGQVVRSRGGGTVESVDEGAVVCVAQAVLRAHIAAAAAAQVDPDKFLFNAERIVGDGGNPRLRFYPAKQDKIDWLAAVYMLQPEAAAVPAPPAAFGAPAPAPAPPAAFAADGGAGGGVWAVRGDGGALPMRGGDVFGGRFG